MQALCAALLLMASTQTALPARAAESAAGDAAQRGLAAEAEAGLAEAVWAFDHWHKAVIRLAPGFGLDTPPLTTRWTHETGALPGSMRLHAWAAPSGLTIELSGSGWHTPSDKAKALLTRNAAHELAHLWQFGHGDAESAPRWLHEGFAEALAAERADTTGATRIGRCAGVLKDGPVRAAQRAGSEAAVYDCGAILIEAVAKGRGEPPSALYAAFAQGGFTEEAFLSLAADARPSLRRSAEAFLQRDWRHAPPSWVMSELSAGRL
jgi:hypothetical protein